MSSPKNNANADSITFQTPVNTFNQAKNGDCSSQLLSIHNIPLKVLLYPNGKGKKQVGDIQIIVAPNKTKDSHIENVAVYCQMYSPALGVMLKESKSLSLQKTSDIIQLQLAKNDYQDIFIKNGIMFICHIEVLKIKYKSNSSTISALKRKVSLKRKASLKRNRSGGNSLSLSDMNLNVFQPPEFNAKSQVNIEMHLNHKMSHPIYSQDINNMYCLYIIPNKLVTKSKHKQTSNVQLVIKMIRLPHNDIRSIEVDYTVEIIPLVLQQSRQYDPIHVFERNVLFSYNKSTETKNLFETAMLDQIGGPFKLKMNIKIINIYQDVGKNAKGKEIKGSWSAFNVERVGFESETVRCKIDYGIMSPQSTSQYYTTTSVDDITENVTNTSKSSKEPQRKDSFSTYNNSSGALPPHSIRNSITLYVDSPLQQVSENKENTSNSNHVTVTPWDQNALTDEMSQSETKQPEPETKIDENMVTKKFRLWLCDDVKLGQYLQNFLSKQWADIRMIEDFNDGTLVTAGISNEQHRKLILKEVKKFVQGKNNFDQLMKNHKSLKPFEKTFQEHGIWTIDELQSITTQQQLRDIIGTDNIWNDIWNIIQSLPLQLQINQIQQKQSRSVKDSMNTYVTNLLEIYKQCEGNEQIQQQVISMMDEYFVEVNNQKSKYMSLVQNNSRPSSATSGTLDDFDYSHQTHSNTNNIILSPNPPVKQTVALMKAHLQK